ncbi:hypothetical protein [Nocardioides sp.]|uniref:hypothetical protein n=1 Tax=Nocardioides sp. TaxID=35761 RepID=UPI003D1062FE
MKWAIAASSAAVVGVVAVSAFGVPGLLGGAEPIGPAGVPSASSEGTQDYADSVFEAFDGTMDQRDASGMLQAWALNGAMDECISAGGFPEWDFSAARNRAPATTALVTSVFFARPMSHQYSHVLIDIVDQRLAMEGTGGRVMSRSERDVMHACSDSTTPASDETAVKDATPPGVSELREKWWAMLARLDQRFGDADSYDDCVREQLVGTFPEAEAQDFSWQISLQRAAPRASDTPRSATDDNLTHAWIDYVNLEEEFESADWRCRGAVYNEHIDDARDAVADFADDHRDDIEAAQAGWSTIVQDAEDLGAATE